MIADEKSSHADHQQQEAEHRQQGADHARALSILHRAISVIWAHEAEISTDRVKMAAHEEHTENPTDTTAAVAHDAASADHTAKARRHADIMAAIEELGKHL